MPDHARARRPRASQAHGFTPPTAPWRLDATALKVALQTSDSGLSPREASRRQHVPGHEPLVADSRPDWPRLLLRQFASPLVLILLFGAAVSLVLRDWIDAAIIGVIVIGSALLGFAQEWRASLAVAQLRQRVALSARVQRGGSEHRVPVASVVVGDIVHLAAGNLVPADAVLLQARDFLVSEAALTGESMPVEKRAGVCAAATPLARRDNMVFLGTSVRSGTATVLVTATGRATEFGAVAERIAQREPETEFARGVRRFGELLLRVMIVMALFVVVVNQWLGRPWVDSMLFAVALAVGLSPELLPAIVSVTVVRGARAMARRGVIVRRLEAIENLGSIDVLCTDKTGTLTNGTVALDAALDARGQASATVAHWAYVNAALETGIANPLDAALVAAAKRESFDTGGLTKIDEIPYDFQRRRLTIVVAENDVRLHRMITKGAFDNVLAVSSELADGTATTPLDEPARTRLREFFRQRSEQGFRVLGLATRVLPAQPSDGVANETSMCFEGFLLFLDPPKPGAAQTLKDLAALGVRVKLITGDNRHVAAHVAGALGLATETLLTG